MRPRLTAPEIAPEHSWFKSSYSDAGQNCVEAAHLHPAAIAIRDSKNPTGPALLLPSTTWTAFITHITQDEE
ncbi:DUF397 domain-containing protein [Streptomyces sp. TRM68367]|uniref:DUF397 domain-containing protein n=1 Tax=Streptomyces sp. TRM68367 TaxID=2758415 RepID=UPI00165C747D|nr:DUF397 domain-containing protein [Streptomyces sp. TRM68367]MBC9724475.1 DUF397 domain-containing protein [Streptomyces sp. TRM68367]